MKNIRNSFLIALLSILFPISLIAQQQKNGSDPNLGNPNWKLISIEWKIKDSSKTITTNNQTPPDKEAAPVKYIFKIIGAIDPTTITFSDLQFDKNTMVIETKTTTSRSSLDVKQKETVKQFKAFLGESVFPKDQDEQLNALKKKYPDFVKKISDDEYNIALPPEFFLQPQGKTTVEDLDVAPEIKEKIDLVKKGFPEYIRKYGAPKGKIKCQKKKCEMTVSMVVPLDSYIKRK